MVLYRIMFFFVLLNVDDIGEIVKKIGYVIVLGENFGLRYFYRKLWFLDILVCWNIDLGENIDYFIMDFCFCRVDFYFLYIVKI